MERFTLLETLEDILERSKGVPFSSKCVVDKDEVLEYTSSLFITDKHQYEIILNED